MGCWNGTCALSNLPIHSGDEVIGVLYVQIGNDLDGGTLVYPNDLYEIIPVFFNGEYDDYGSIENIPDKQIKVLTELLSNDPYLIEDDDYYNLKRTDVISLVERGLVSFNLKRFGVEGQVGLLMFHKKVFENLISYQFENNIWELINSSSFIYMRSLAKHSFKSLDEIRMQAILDEDDDYKSSTVKKFEEQSKDPVIYEELENFKRAIALWNFYSKTRKSITPQSGAGSQDYSTEYQVALAKEVIRMAEELEKRREE